LWLQQPPDRGRSVFKSPGDVVIWSDLHRDPHTISPYRSSLHTSIGSAGHGRTGRRPTRIRSRHSRSDVRPWSQHMSRIAVIVPPPDPRCSAPRPDPSRCCAPPVSSKITTPSIGRPDRRTKAAPHVTTDNSCRSTASRHPADMSPGTPEPLFSSSLSPVLRFPFSPAPFVVDVYIYMYETSNTIATLRIFSASLSSLPSIGFIPGLPFPIYAHVSRISRSVPYRTSRFPCSTHHRGSLDSLDLSQSSLWPDEPFS
jgi:hypothetical protein